MAPQRYACDVSARPFVQRLITPTLAVALACPAGVAFSLVPTPAMAGPAAAAEDEDAQLAEAREMFERGRSKYDTFDYEGAIDVWQQAMAKVPPSQAGVRNAMVYNIALAQEKAFDVDKDVAHLRQAVLLLEQWVGSYKAMFKKTPETEAEVGKAQKRIKDLNARIKRIEAGEDTTTAAPPPADNAEAGTSIEFDTGYTPPPEVMRERKKAQANNRTEGMIAAGWTVGAIGGIIFWAGAGSTIYTARTPGQAGLGASIGTLVFGTAMVVTGGVLLGKGYKEKKANEQAAYSVAPYVNRTGGGAAFSMRF